MPIYVTPNDIWKWIRSSCPSYIDYMTKLGYKNVIINQKGLCVRNVYPHIGASPDIIWKCDCCGTGVLEIKCPPTANQHDTFIEYAQTHNSFLEQKGRKGIIITRDHAYYFQVQMQLYVLNMDTCHFVIWKKGGILVPISRIFGSAG